MRLDALALTIAIVISIATPLSIAKLSHVSSIYAMEVAKLAIDWLKPFAPTNANVLRLLEEAYSNASLSLLYKALELDSDGDGVPDAFEYLDGLSPYLPRSFGYSDLAYFAGRIVVDGWAGDWLLNSGCVEELKFYVNGSRIAPVSSIMATIKGDSLLMAVVFSKGFVYGNTSVLKFSIAISVDGHEIVPSVANQWGLALEAEFSFLKVFKALTSSQAKLVLEVRSKDRVVETVVASFNPLSLPSLGPRCWRGFVEPLWARLRSVEQGLPMYFVAAYGDSQQPGWTQVEYRALTYKMFEQLRALDPIAVIGAGDETDAGLRSQIREFLRATAFIPNHWIVAGNHDWSYTKYADRQFWYNYTVPDLYYRDIGKWRFVLLNAFALDSGLLKELNDLLAESCNEGKFLVLVWHVPITYTHYNYPTDLSYWQAESLRSLVKEFRSCIKLMLFGHLHVFRFGKYDGIPYIITGGGGGRLASAKYGIPVHHFVALILFPNGTFSYIPISIENSEISVVRMIESPGVVKYVIKNAARDIWGKPVTLPLRVETFVRGLHLEVMLLAKPGITVVRISCNSSRIEVTANASSWFTYIWGIGVLRGSRKGVAISIPMGNAKGVSIGVARGSIVIDKCEGCTVTTILRFRIDGRVYSVCLHPVSAGGRWVVNPSYVTNASGVKTVVLDTVTVVISDGSETLVKELHLPIAPPELKVRYFDRYVGKTLRFEICFSGANSVSVLIDGELVASFPAMAGKPSCINVSIDVSKFGEGVHTLKVIASSPAGSKSVINEYFIACWTPPEILAPKVIRVESVVSTLKIGVKSVAPLTVVIKCLNTSVSKVSSSNGGYAEISLKPIDLGIVSNGTYVVEIVAYDEVGHESRKRIELVVGSPTRSKFVNTLVTTTTASSISVTTAIERTFTSSPLEVSATSSPTGASFSSGTSTTPRSAPTGSSSIAWIAIAVLVIVVIAIATVLTFKRKG